MHRKIYELSFTSNVPGGDGVTLHFELSGTKSWYRKLEKTLERISETPFSFGFALENDDHDEEIRQATFKTTRGLPCRILFIVLEQTVFVIHIRGFGQDDIPATDLRLPSMG